MKLKIVALPQMSKITPTGEFREELTHHMLINMDISEEKIKRENLAWCQHICMPKERIFEKRNLENADLDILRALISSGALYVVEDLESDSEAMGSDTDLRKYVQM